MPNDSKTYIVNDQATETDALDFTPYVETLADIIQTGNTPLTIGVFGTWGSGKTSLMKMMKNKLPNDFTVAWFDAWKYDKEETLWRAFILSVLTAIRSRVKEGQPTEDLDYLETMLYRAIEIEKAGGVTIDLAKLGGAVTKGGVQLALSFIPGGAVLSEFVKKVQELGAEALTNEATDAIQRERTKIQIEQVRFLEQFQKKFRVLVEQYISNNNGRLVIFVDDLDRCLPEKAIEVLEAIKLFLDAPDCVFILGLDQEVIARGIEIKHKELLRSKDGAETQQRNTVDGARYLEKIIQLPFQIPPVEKSDMGRFVRGLSAKWPHYDCALVFAEGLSNNPRQIKRTVNVFLMLWYLAQRRKDKLGNFIKPVRLAKVIAIQTVYPELYELLKEEPRYLRDLEEYYRRDTFHVEKQLKKDKEVETSTDWLKSVKVESSVPDWLSSPEEESMPQNADNEKSDMLSWLKTELPPALVNFTGRITIRRLLTLHPYKQTDVNFIDLSPEELRLYFTLTRSSEAFQLESSETSRMPFEPQLIRIPDGKFLMGTSIEQAERAIQDGMNAEWVKVEQPQHTVYLSEYFIGKYPITNREYREFIREMKYKPPQGWDGDQYPAEKGDHPVVYISWEDAKQYCRWLSKKTKQNYRLPTEAEWEKAARGIEGRVFPWDDNFDKNFTNTADGKIGNTTSVGSFSPQGDSPYGCADLAGNVWEWCADWFSEDEYKTHSETIKNPKGPDEGVTRTLRGGSFFSNRRGARSACRIRNNPQNANKDYGFRVVRSQIKIWPDEIEKDFTDWLSSPNETDLSDWLSSLDSA